MGYYSWPFVHDYLGEPVPEETFTQSHLSWSSTILYHLPPSTKIHSILPVQFTCSTLFLHHLCPGFLWSTSWSGTLHIILAYIFSPNHCLFATRAHTIAQPWFYSYLLSCLYSRHYPSTY